MRILKVISAVKKALKIFFTYNNLEKYLTESWMYSVTRYLKKGIHRRPILIIFTKNIFFISNISIPQHTYGIIKQHIIESRKIDINYVMNVYSLVHIQKCNVLKH